ncbi:MAG: hypothetical protein AAGJ80_11225 [Cyanobacteria bacterium J06553_1]
MLIAWAHVNENNRVVACLLSIDAVAERDVAVGDGTWVNAITVVRRSKRLEALHLQRNRPITVTKKSNLCCKVHYTSRCGLVVALCLSFAIGKSL